MTEVLFELTFLLAAPFWALMILLLTVLLGPLGRAAYLAVRPRWPHRLG